MICRVTIGMAQQVDYAVASVQVVEDTVATRPYHRPVRNMTKGLWHSALKPKGGTGGILQVSVLSRAGWQPPSTS